MTGALGFSTTTTLSPLLNSNDFALNIFLILNQSKIVLGKENKNDFI